MPVQNHKNILILGATSAIGIALVKKILQQNIGCHLYLFARDITALQMLVSNNTSTNKIDFFRYDLQEENEHLHLAFPIDYAVILAGYLPSSEKEYAACIQINYSGLVHFIEVLLKDNLSILQHLMITSSVAGIRVRRANYHYASSKAAITAYASGLRNKLYGSTHITTILPGFINTKMIAHLQTAKWLTIEPMALSSKYYKWLGSKKNVVYSQWQWWAIMLLIKCIPEFVFKRIRFKIT